MDRPLGEVMIAAGDEARMGVATLCGVGAAVARAAVVTEVTVETAEDVEAAAPSEASCRAEDPAILDGSARGAQHATFCGAIHGIPVRHAGPHGGTQANRVGI